MKAEFIKDVRFGLSQPDKKLSSKYFYDKAGDELFMQIMAMPEYYLTRAELEIFTEQTQKMIDCFGIEKDQFFELIELGAGDGTKTKKLLEGLAEQGFQFDYLPIDISKNVLEHLMLMLKKEMPSVSVKPQQGDYFKTLHELRDSHNPKVVLFLGSNIGNLSDKQATEFIYELGSNLSVGDKLIIGVDKIKSAEIVLPAYNDAAGITESFNLNLLARINNELGGNFVLSNFEHAPEYEEAEGIARSYLRCKVEQTVKIADIGASFYFKQGEKIHMEVSRKYTQEILQKIIQDTDFVIIDELTDQKNYFSDFVLERC